MKSLVHMEELCYQSVALEKTEEQNPLARTNIGLVGRGMGLNRGGCEMAEIMAGFGMRRFRRERDLLILTGGIRDSYKIDAGMRDENKEK